MKRRTIPKSVGALLLMAGLWMGGARSWAFLPPIGQNQFPGDGSVVAGHVSSYHNNPTAPTGFHSSATLTVSGNTVIDWGNGCFSGNSINVTGPGLGHSGAGFNVGQNAALTINHAAGTTSSLLNVDVSGNPSQILGMIQTTGSSFPVYVANANGIIVGSTGVILAGGGFGLLGYDLTSQANSSFSGTVTVTHGMIERCLGLDSGAVVVQSGASFLAHSGSSLLLAGSSVNASLGTQVPGAGTATHPFNILSGYAFQGFNATNGSYAKAPTAAPRAFGDIDLTGPSSTYTFLGSSLVLSAGSISTRGDVVLPGSPGLQWGTVFVNHGTIAFASAVNNLGSTGGFVNVGGTVQSYQGGDVTLNVGGAILNLNSSSHGTITSAGNLTLVSNGNWFSNGIVNEGLISGAGKTSVNATNSFVNNEGGTIYGGTYASVSAGGPWWHGGIWNNEGAQISTSSTGSIYLASAPGFVNNFGGVIGTKGDMSTPIYVKPTPIFGGQVYGNLLPYQTP